MGYMTEDRQRLITRLAEECDAKVEALEKDLKEKELELRRTRNSLDKWIVKFGTAKARDAAKKRIIESEFDPTGRDAR